MPIANDFTTQLDLAFFSSCEFEALTEKNVIENANIIGRNALRVLMMGWQDVRSLVNMQTLQAILVKRDHELLRGMRLAFQQGFEYLYETQLKDRSFNEVQMEQIQLYLSNCLSLLPFADITPYESFQIPQYIDGQWQLVDYKVIPIELTPTTGLRKLFLYDADRVFAYGLEPLFDNNAQPHLIFMGTNAVGQGLLSQLNTDLEPFETAGKKLYRTGLARLNKWLDAQEKKVHVCGMSLGGSLSLLLAMHQGEKLSRVDVLNPPGIYEPFYKSRFDRWDACTEKPIVCIQRQGDDLVSRLGNWKHEWQLLEVMPPQEKKGPNFIADHALNYAGIAGTKMHYVTDLHQDNQFRKAQTVLFYIIIRAFVYYGAMLPYRYLVHPLLHFLFEHKQEVALGFLAAALCLIFPLINVPLLGGFAVLNLFFNAAIVGTVASEILDYARDKINNNDSGLLTKASIWFKHQSRTIQVMLGIGFSLVFVSVSLLPLPLLTSIYLLLATPLMAKVGIQMTRSYNIVMGIQKNEPAALHQPDLPRNSSMDIYQNKMTQHMTICEILEYQRAKKIVQLNDNIGQIVGEKTIEETVCIHASKADLYDLKKTVQLVHRFGLHSSALKASLLEQYEEYALGKQSSNAI